MLVGDPGAYPGEPIGGSLTRKVTQPWAIAFNDWLNRFVTAGDHDALLHFHEEVPYLARAHLYLDHFIPLLTLTGIAGPWVKGTILHQNWDIAVPVMGAFAF